MNKIVREHYPVANLPEDLRVGLQAGETVRVVIETEGGSGMHSPSSPISAEDLLARRSLLQSENRPSVTTEEAVVRIRALRDEWDD